MDTQGIDSMLPASGTQGRQSGDKPPWAGGLGAALTIRTGAVFLTVNETRLQDDAASWLLPTVRLEAAT